MSDKGFTYKSHGTNNDVSISIADQEAAVADRAHQ
jgi:hypothetical protein